MGGDPPESGRAAVLNIAAYHSPSFEDDHMLAALPSCRVCLDWAQGVLFPEAERGERVVVCMRAARFWGLGRRGRYGRSLFSPATTRGRLTADGDVLVSREDVLAAVRAVLA